MKPILFVLMVAVMGSGQTPKQGPPILKYNGRQVTPGMMLRVNANDGLEEPMCDDVVTFGHSSKAIKDIFPSECGTQIVSTTACATCSKVLVTPKLPEYVVLVQEPGWIAGVCNDAPPGKKHWVAPSCPSTAKIEWRSKEHCIYRCVQTSAKPAPDLSGCHIERYDPGYDPDSAKIPQTLPYWNMPARAPGWVKDDSLRIVCGGHEEKK